jgi:hypothetical protein
MGRPKGSKNKKDLVDKVSEESGVEADKLKRLPIKEIEKIDALVEDVKPSSPSDTLPKNETPPKSDETPPKSDETPPKSEEPLVVETKRYVGKHPITKEPVYI